MIDYGALRLMSASFLMAAALIFVVRGLDLTRRLEKFRRHAIIKMSTLTAILFIIFITNLIISDFSDIGSGRNVFTDIPFILMSISAMLVMIAANLGGLDAHKQARKALPNADNSKKEAPAIERLINRLSIKLRRAIGLKPKSNLKKISVRKPLDGSGAERLSGLLSYGHGVSYGQGDKEKVADDTAKGQSPVVESNRSN